MNFIETMANLWKSTGIAHSIAYGEWQNYVMILVSFVLFYLAIVKQFEPLLLLPISFGMFIINIPGANDVLFGTGHGASADKLAEMAAQGKRLLTVSSITLSSACQKLFIRRLFSSV